MVQKGRRETAPLAPQVFMIFRPALRFLTGPRPPADLAARRFAAVIRPPLLFFAIVKSPSFKMQFYLEADLCCMEKWSHALPAGIVRKDGNGSTAYDV